MPIFIPPNQSPAAIILPAPKYGTTPETIVGHGNTYIVTGNTILPPHVISRALSTAKTAREAVDSLLMAYRDRGYFLVAITAQPEGHKLYISVIQGMITDIEGTRGVRAFFGNTKERTNLKKRRLIRDNILASSYAERSGHNLHLNISPASNPGGAVLDIQQERQKGYFPVSGVVNFGNYGSRYSSGYVYGGSVAGNLGHGIQLSTNFTKGLPGLRRISLGSVYYQVGGGGSIVTPYGIYGFNMGHSHYALGKATKPLSPSGNTLTYDFTGVQLPYASESTRWSLNEGFHHVKYLETVFNFYKLVSQRYNYASIGTSLSRGVTLAHLPGVVSGGATFNLGVSPRSGTFYDGRSGLPTSHFRYIDFNTNYNQQLPKNFSLSFSMQGQWSAQTLPSQQQWTLGGFGNMASWEPSVVVGDSGYVSKLEVYAPDVSRFHSHAKLGAFIETGGATYKAAPRGECPWDSLTDAGVDLTLQLPYKFSAHAMAAIPVWRRGFTQAGRRNLSVNRLDAFFVVQKGF